MFATLEFAYVSFFVSFLLLSYIINNLIEMQSQKCCKEESFDDCESSVSVTEAMTSENREDELAY